MATMFDTIHSSFDFGDGRTNVIYATRDLGNSLLYFWLSPSGQLFKRQLQMCHRRVETYPGHPQYDHKYSWKNVHYEPTGENGKMTPSSLTAYLDIYQLIDNSLDHSTSVRVHFIKGLLVGFTAE